MSDASSETLIETVVRVLRWALAVFTPGIALSILTVQVQMAVEARQDGVPVTLMESVVSWLIIPVAVVLTGLIAPKHKVGMSIFAAVVISVPFLMAPPLLILLPITGVLAAYLIHRRKPLSSQKPDDHPRAS